MRFMGLLFLVYVVVCNSVQYQLYVRFGYLFKMVQGYQNFVYNQYLDIFLSFQVLELGYWVMKSLSLDRNGGLMEL